MNNFFFVDFWPWQYFLDAIGVLSMANNREFELGESLAVLDL